MSRVQRGPLVVVLLLLLSLGSTVLPASAQVAAAAPVAGSTVWSWGTSYVPIEQPSPPPSLLPAQFADGGAFQGKTVTAVSFGTYSGCAVASGAAYCWGRNDGGGLGNPSVYYSATPVPVDTSGVLAGKVVTAIAVGESFACAIAGGAAYCWGSNGQNTLGQPAYPSGSGVPVAVDLSHGLAGKVVTDISAGSQHVCVIADNRPYCWGVGHFGADLPAVPGVSGNPYSIPVDVHSVLAGKTLTQLTSGRTFSCLLASGKPYCWGENPGSFGDNTMFGSATPVATDTTGVLAGKTLTALAAGGGHTCGLAAGKVYCWGSNFVGELGFNSNAASTMQPVPVDMSGALAGTQVTAIAAGQTNTCVIASGRNYCWGSNLFGQLGVGARAFSPAPLAVADDGVLAGRTPSLIAIGPLAVMTVLSEPAPPATAGAFAALVPTRIMDTRLGLGVGGVLQPGQPASLQVTGTGGVPTAGVAAVVVNVTVTASTAPGYLTVYPGGTTPPDVSNLNFDTDQTVANAVTVPVSSTGKISLTLTSAGPAHVIVDIAGYYVAGAPTKAGAFGAVTPTRVVDSRSGLGVAGPIPSGGSVSVQIAGRGGIPSTGVGAIVANVTVTAPSASGYLTVYPSGVAEPTVSNLNFRAAQTVPNLVTTAVGTDGRIVISNRSAGPLQVLVDVAGYYRSGTASLRGTVTPLTPARVFDTRTPRNGARPLAAGGSVAVSIGGAGGIPATGVAAVIANITVAGTTGQGSISVYPSGVVRTTVSTLNFLAGQTVPNMVIVPVGADGRIVVTNDSSGSLSLIVDVAGYVRSR